MHRIDGIIAGGMPAQPAPAGIGQVEECEARRPGEHQIQT